MFLYYFKIAWRNIIKKPGYATINIIGLAVGMACSLLLLLWVAHELSYDRFHANADDLYRVVQDDALLGNLQQIRPGDRMVGCNTDGDCHDYQVTTAAMWDLGRLHQVLADWPPDLSLMVYLVTGEADAWVIQAQPRGEKTR